MLHRSANDTALSGPLRFSFTDKEVALRAESIATLVTDKALFMPLSTNSADN